MAIEFPVKAIIDENTIWYFDNLDELACSIEWCNTDDPEDDINIVEARDRPIRLHVVACDVKKFELE